MFKPLKNIKSRYNTIVNNNYYSVLPGSSGSSGTNGTSGSSGTNGTSGSSGSTNIQINNFSLKGSNQGYVYAPYIMVEDVTPIIESREWRIKIVRKRRKEKLQKLGWSKNK